MVRDFIPPPGRGDRQDERNAEAMPNPYLLNPGRAFLALSTFWKVICGAVLIALILFATNGAGNAIDSIHKWKKDRALAEKQKEVDGLNDQIGTLKKQKADLEKRGNDAEARATFAESKEAALSKAVQDKGGQIAQTERKIENEIEAIRRDAGACGALSDGDQRSACVCSKLAAAGFPCEAPGK